MKIARVSLNPVSIMGRVTSWEDRHRGMGNRSTLLALFIFCCFLVRCLCSSSFFSINSIPNYINKMQFMHYPWFWMQGEHYAMCVLLAMRHFHHRQVVTSSTFLKFKTLRLHSDRKKHKSCGDQCMAHNNEPLCPLFSGY